MANHKKRCYYCMRYKSFNSFNKDTTTKDGYYGRCRVCVKDTKTHAIKGHFLYGTGNLDTLMKNKKYRQDKKRLFRMHGNGWWMLEGFPKVVKNPHKYL